MTSLCVSGRENHYTWNLFDRLTHAEAGPHLNRSERVKRNRELQCGFTLYGCDGDTLAWGVAKEAIWKASEGRAELRTPIKFQGQYHDYAEYKK